MTEVNGLEFDPNRQIAIIWDIEDVRTYSKSART